VLSDGGHLEQYDPPATLLAKPANEFVAQFVGSDRGIKRLGVTPIPDVLSPPRDEPAPTVDSDATLRDALAALLDGGTGWVAVRGPDGSIRGGLTLGDIVAASTPD
jgi:osmoprotectant transport system ATP-binding protein